MDTLSKDGTERWNLWEDEEYLTGCVLSHHAKKGDLPGERDLEKEFLISEGSVHLSGGLWDSQNNLSLLQPWIGFFTGKQSSEDSAVFVSQVASSELSLASCDNVRSRLSNCNELGNM